MSSTPKPRDGDASVADRGALSPLEQTVMGVAPPPPASAAEHLALGAAVPPAVDPASLVLPSSTRVAAPSAPPTLSPASFVLPSSTIVSASGAAPVSPPPSSMVAAPSSIAAAPMIAVSTTQPIAVPRAGLAAPFVHPAADAPAHTGSATGNDVGETLRVEPRAAVTTAAPTAAAEPVVQAPRETTLLTDDYLRQARDAALQQLGQSAPSTSPIALASTERAPLAEVAIAIANALPNGGDTHRSIAPDLEPIPESTRARSVSGSTNGGVAGAAAGAARGFEPVPVLRAPLAESLSNALGPMAELGGTRNLLPPSSRPLPAPPSRAREGVGRWLLLAAVALVTVAVVSVGGRLWHRYRANIARERAAGVEASAPGAPSTTGIEPPSASRALLANRPAVDTGVDGHVRVISATTGAAASGNDPGAGATQESQLAATAGRYVLGGNYAEALPLYRQLERGWPENTSYAAMARLLEKKVGSRNDTRTITPAASTTP